MNHKSRRENHEQEVFWREVIEEAEGRNSSIRDFCERRGLPDHQFYWWKRKLEGKPQGRRGRRKILSSTERASFALVTGDPVEAGIEIVLRGDRRLKIGRGVDARTLAIVLSVLEGRPC